jgi:hypothetical protein
MAFHQVHARIIINKYGLESRNQSPLSARLFALSLIVSLELDVCFLS